MKRLFKNFYLYAFISILTIAGAQANVTSCMDMDLYELTKESRRLNSLTIKNEDLLFLQTLEGTQCMAGDSLQCVDYDIKIDNVLFENSQDTANEILSLIEKRNINKVCTAKILKARELEKRSSLIKDERINIQLFSYICTMASLLEDTAKLFDDKDAKERKKVSLENQVAVLKEAIKKKEKQIKITENKINEISDKIGTPSKTDEDGKVTDEGSGLLGDLGKGQRDLKEAQDELEACRKQNTDAAAAHAESESEEPFTPPCDVAAKEEEVQEAKEELQKVAIDLIKAMLELTGAETYAIIETLKGSIYGQINVDGDKQSVNFQVDGNNFQLANIGEAVSANFGISLDDARSFDSEGAKEQAGSNASVQFLVDLVERLGKTDEEAEGSSRMNIENINFNYNVSCTETTLDTSGMFPVSTCTKEDSVSNFFVDPDYGFDYSDQMNKGTEEFLNGFMSLTGDDIADTSNLGAIAYAASLQAQQGRKDKIGDKENPETGTIWGAIKKDQDAMARLETGGDSLETIEQEIAEASALIKDRLCVYNGMLKVYRKLFDDMGMKKRFLGTPEDKQNKKEEAETFLNNLVETGEIDETELEKAKRELEMMFDGVLFDPKKFDEELVASTKYLYTYVYKQSTKSLEAYATSGYLGNYNGPLPREIASEYVCVIKTDDVAACRAKYSALSKESTKKRGCRYTGTVPGPAPPIMYERECKKEDQGKKSGNFLTCTCY